MPSNGNGGFYCPCGSVLVNLFQDEKMAKAHDVLQGLAIRIIHEAKVREWASECHFEPGKDL